MCSCCKISVFLLQNKCVLTGVLNLLSHSSSQTGAVRMARVQSVADNLRQNMNGRCFCKASYTALNVKARANACARCFLSKSDNKTTILQTLNVQFAGELFWQNIKLNRFYTKIKMNFYTKIKMNFYSKTWQWKYYLIVAVCHWYYRAWMDSFLYKTLDLTSSLYWLKHYFEFDCFLCIKL